MKNLVQDKFYGLGKGSRNGRKAVGKKLKRLNMRHAQRNLKISIEKEEMNKTHHLSKLKKNLDTSIRERRVLHQRKSVGFLINL
jgi:hypothetical protein